MPRLSPALLQRAIQRSRHLTRLLPVCRDLRSAQNELRWLKAHIETLKLGDESGRRGISLTTLIKRRSKGEPLQYILGNQPFGDLDILCKPGVLIPRSDTETYVQRIAEALTQLSRHYVLSGQKLNIFDLCAGTGCISLLLHSRLKPAHSSAVHPSIQILGVDVSTKALQLADQNLQHNMRLGHLHQDAVTDIEFQEVDVLESPIDRLSLNSGSEINTVILSNPPYISPTDFAIGGRTAPGVRRFEPRLALVPRTTGPAAAIQQEDVFYPKILEAARKTDAKLVCMEVGDFHQAQRVAALATKMLGRDILLEIWCDDGSSYLPLAPNGGISRGSSGDLDRAVIVWTGSWATWRKTRVNHELTE